MVVWCRPSFVERLWTSVVCLVAAGGCCILTWGSLIQMEQTANWPINRSLHWSPSFTETMQAIKTHLWWHRRRHRHWQRHTVHGWSTVLGESAQSVTVNYRWLPQLLSFFVFLEATRRNEERKREENCKRLVNKVHRKCKGKFTTMKRKLLCRLIKQCTVLF